MRIVVIVAIVCGNACSDSDPAAIENDQACIQAKAMFADWPNGVGYCSGDTFVACDDTTGMPMPCGSLHCVQYAVPRTILVGCNLDEADPACDGVPGGIWRVCDGRDELFCVDGRLFVRHEGACSAPLR